MNKWHQMLTVNNSVETSNCQEIISTKVTYHRR